MDFENIYQEYFKDVFLFLRSISAGEELAQELTQETFMKALKKIDSFDGRKDIRAWLFTIARNTHDTTDFSALRALEILKHLKSAHFSAKNGFFSVFYGSSRYAFLCKHEKAYLFDPGVILYDENDNNGKPFSRVCEYWADHEKVIEVLS